MAGAFAKQTGKALCACSKCEAALNRSLESQAEEDLREAWGVFLGGNQSFEGLRHPLIIFARDLVGYLAIVNREREAAKLEAENKAGAPERDRRADEYTRQILEKARQQKEEDDRIFAAVEQPDDGVG